MAEHIPRRELFLRRQQEHESTREDNVPRPIVCLSREAMACLFEIQFAEGSLDRKTAIRAFDWIDAIERQLTVYRSDSEISHLNAEGFENPIVIEERLFNLLEDCHRLWAETGGAFDITAGPLIKAWGFKRREGRVPSPNELAETMKSVGMGHIRLDRSKRTAELCRPGMEVNFGGIGKGYALDRVSEWLNQQGARDFLLGAGQSSLLARGSRPLERGWPVDIQHPADPSRMLAKVFLHDQGLSTSANTEQYFEEEGRRFGHILDPRNGWPVEGMIQVAVVATTAARAEVLSTAFFILGVEWASDYCRRNPEVGSILVTMKPDGDVVDVHVVGTIDVVTEG